MAKVYHFTVIFCFNLLFNQFCTRHPFFNYDFLLLLSSKEEVMLSRICALFQIFSVVLRYFVIVGNWWLHWISNGWQLWKLQIKTTFLFLYFSNSQKIWTSCVNSVAFLNNCRIRASATHCMNDLSLQINITVKICTFL